VAHAGEIDVDGRAVRVSNLDKVLFLETGFTKAQVIDYYARIADVLLPHLRARPVTLKRYPDGPDGEFFYEKNAPKHRPSWVKTSRVFSETRGDDIHYCLLQDRPSLVWAANLAALELHTFLHRAPRLTRPESLVFDLDPGAPATIVECCRVGVMVRRLFAELGMEALAKTSGSKGLQVFVPLNTATTYEKTKPFALAVAERLRESAPEHIVSRMEKRLRGGKVLIDWSQNDEHKTTVSVYSLRAKSHPSVSAPVKWSEVEKCARTGKSDTLAFHSAQVLKRVAKLGDLFAPMLKLRQRLPAVADLARVPDRAFAKFR
jgi:bifunctional non-homologous end joining protein LigD